MSTSASSISAISSTPRPVFCDSSHSAAAEISSSASGRTTRRRFTAGPGGQECGREPRSIPEPAFLDAELHRHVDRVRRAIPRPSPHPAARRHSQSGRRRASTAPVPAARSPPQVGLRRLGPCTGNLSAPPDRMPHPPHDIDAKSHSSIDLGRSLRLYEQAAIHVTRAQRLVVGADAPARLAAAAAWLGARAPAAEVLVVGPSWEACDDLVRATTARTGARFGTLRLTLDRLAVRLATPALARDRCAPATGLSLSAVAARAVHLVLAERGLAYFTPVADRPGFPLAFVRTLAELRLNGVAPEALAALGALGHDLGMLAGRVARELEEAGLADRAIVFQAAVAAARVDPPPHPMGLPVLLLDLPVTTACEAELVAALARSAPDMLATAPAGDGRSLERLETALGCAASPLDAPRRPSSLHALKTHLFELGEPPAAALDDSVSLSSWPGEARECVEIARGVQAEAARGVPFDRMAVFLRSPAEYRPHLEEAFRRASIPAFFARGTARPDPAGRALLALLACKTERLSARRFAEYVSLAQVPDPGAAADADARWTPPEDDLLPLPPPPEPRTGDERGDGSPRAPWRWERLLVEASVIGGKERWKRRLDGLEEELRLRREALTDEEEEARGLAFDVVFVPGLAEKLFPRKIVEDPILLDPHRRALEVPALATQPARVGAERLALRLAVGAARERVVLSWPRVDIEQARPRVPSLYGLQALRAASGRLPGFDELEARGGDKTGGRLGWPAAQRPADAIDEAES